MVYRFTQRLFFMRSCLYTKLEVRNIIITIVTNNLTYFFNQMPQLQVWLLFFSLFVLMRLLFEGGACVYFVWKPADRWLNKIHKVTILGLIDTDSSMWSLSVLLSKKYSIPEKCRPHIYCFLDCYSRYRLVMVLKLWFSFVASDCVAIIRGWCLRNMVKCHSFIIFFALIVFLH